MSLASAIRQLPGLSDVSRDRENKALIKDLDGLFEQAKRDREQHESQWLLNYSFYRGQQWVFFNESTGKIEKPKRLRKGQVLMTVNKVRGNVRTEFAKLAQQRPQAKAQPASGEPDDRDQAKVCDAILSYLDATDGSERAQKRALLWSIIVGTGILETYWNKDKGEILRYPDNTLVATTVDEPDETGALVKVTKQEEVPHPKAGEPLTDQNGDPVHLGDIETCDVSPFEFFPDPFGMTIAEKNWAFKVKIRSAEYVMERFGVEVTPRDLTGDHLLEGQMGLISSRSQPKKGVVVKEFWQRSTKKYPEGRYVVYVDDKVLVNDENPYPKCQLPFAAFVHVPVPGSFWGDSTVSDQIDPQRNLNKSRSQSIEIRNLTARPKVIVHKNALDAGKTITNTPGEVIEVNPIPNIQEPVKFIDGPEVPDSYWKDIERSMSELREVSGIHEVSNASVPSGVTAARAIGFLQEQDDLRLGPTAQDYEDAIGELAKMRLALARQFYDEPRTVRVAGKDNAVKVVEFRKEDIPAEVDVRVQTGSSLPKSRVARQQFLLDLWEKKLPIPARAFISMLELGEVEGIYDKINRDINQAERENERMKAGEPVTAAKWHEHDAHIDEHLGYMKGEEYERLAAEDPAVEQAFLGHFAQHEQFLLEAQMNAAAAGAPPPSPVASAVADAPQEGVVGETEPPDLAA